MRKLSSFSRTPLRATSLLLCSTAFISGAYAANLPQGGQLASGSTGQAAISISPDQRTMTITQKGPVAALDWTSFSIGANNLVDIRQTKATDLLINRVTGSEASLINGTLKAQGNVFLINPNGISIGTSGKVTAKGFLASTLNMTSSDGSYSFAKQGAQALAVDGKITTTGTAGYIVLMGGQVTLGKNASLNAVNIALGAGESASLTLPSATADLAFREIPTLPSTNPAPPLAAGGSISIAGTVVSSNGSLILDAGGIQSKISIDGTVSVSNSDVTISLDDPLANLRIGNATGTRRGTLNFAPNQPNSTLNINGIFYNLIWTAEDLRNISKDMKGYYALAQNIDFKGAPAFTNTVIPFSTRNADFLGGLNGLGHSLSNIRISVTPDAYTVGLFGKFGVNNDKYPYAFATNLGLTNIQITPSSDTWSVRYLGAISGLASHAVFSNNWVTGTIQSPINSRNQADIGGLVGYATGGTTQFLGNYFAGRITGPSLASSSASVGGIAGVSIDAVFRNNKVTQTTLSGGRNLGGISGYAIGIESSGNSFDGNITSWNSDLDGSLENAATVGGLYGTVAEGFLSGDSAQGTLDARGTYATVGGLVGRYYWSTDPVKIGQVRVGIANSQFLRGTIRGGAYSSVGGIAGVSGGYWIGDALADFEVMRHVSAAANISAGANSYAGGIAGYTDILEDEVPVEPGDIVQYSLLSSSGSITAGKGSMIGGMFGRFRGAAQGMMSTTDIRTSGIAKNVGGIAGLNDGIITDALFLGRLNLARATYKGALVGLMTNDYGAFLGQSLFDLAIGGTAVGAAPLDPESTDGALGPINDDALTAVAGLSLDQMKERANLLNYLTTVEDTGEMAYFNMVEGQLPTLKTAP
ncbi:MAG: filamentous hemagglutinin N-terminal domain-containing protein [Chakrabartia sp.]